MTSPQNGPYQSESSGFELSAEFSISSEFTALQKVSETDMHIVYRGVRHGRIWIIKGLVPQYQELDECRQMLIKEFDIMMRVSHDNIVSAHSIETIPGLGMCIVMEYIDGDMLTVWLRKKRSLKERFKKSLDLADAFDYINKCGIVHRDIKPENILVSRLGEAVKIIDFSHADTDSHTLFKYPAGTEGFISPEQRSSTVPDVRNDVYSFGKVLDLLLPEKRFSHLRSQCHSDIDKRIQGFEELGKKLRSAYRKPLVYSTRIALFAILAVAFLFSLCKFAGSSDEAHELKTEAAEVSNVDKNPESQIEASSTQIPPAEKPNEAVPAKKPDTPIIHLGESNPPYIAPKTEITRGINIDKALAAMNDEWEKSAMLYLDTVTNIENMYPDWSTSRLEIIRSNFLNTLPSSLTEAEREEIKKRLDNNIEYNYKKWQRRRLELKSGAMKGEKPLPKE